MPQSPQLAGAALPAEAEPARKLPTKKDYYARIPARFLKDPNVNPDAKLLRTLLAAYADERTSRTYVGPKTLDRLLRCGRKFRERLQRELIAAGWLRVERERLSGGYFGRRFYILCEPPMALPATGGPEAH